MFLFPSILVVGGIPMPVFYENIPKNDQEIFHGEAETVMKKTKHQKGVLLLALFYFAFTCGIEGFFQSQTFTFGICGAHKMHPEKVRLISEETADQVIFAGSFPDNCLLCKLFSWTVENISLSFWIVSFILQVFWHYPFNQTKTSNLDSYQHHLLHPQCYSLSTCGLLPHRVPFHWNRPHWVFCLSTVCLR